MWQTLKGVGANGVHSIDEFRAAFLQRNPGCVAAGAVPTRTPTNSPPPPTPTRSIHGIPGPGPRVSVAVPLVTPTAAAGPPFHITSIAQPLRTVTPITASGSSAGDLARIRTEQGRRLAADIDLLAARETVARDASRLRVPADIPAASRPAVQRLNARQAELAGNFHAKTVEAYRAAYDSLSSLTRDSLSDGSYEKAQAAAKDAFAERVFAARLAHLQAAQNAIAAERQKAKDPRLVAHLARLKRRYEREEERLERVKKNRRPGSAVPPEMLPKTFVAKTTRRFSP
jgi:hypothetical protein